MSLQWHDGFEDQDLTSFYNTISSASTGTSTRASYGRALIFTGTPGTIKRSITASTDVYVGAAYKITTPIALNMLEFYNESILHVAIALRADGGIDILRNTTVLASSVAGLIVGGAWNYIEVHAKVADAGGVVEVRLNGSASSAVSFSGDTKNGGTLSTIAEVLLRGNSGVSFDDLYICDGLGTTNNTFLGDMRVQSLIPTGAGSWTQFTPSTGSNYQNVDEQPASSTDYNGSSVVGARDTYSLTDLLAGTSAVLGVRNTAYWHKSDVGLASMKHVVANPTTVYAADNFNRANGALGSTSTGAKAWTSVLGTFQILSNVAGQNGSAGTRNWNFIDIGVTSYELQMTVASVGADAFGFAFRHVDSNNAMFAVFSGSSAGPAAIVKYVGGTPTTLASGSSYTGQVGDVIKLTVVGNVISLYKNGVLQCTVTDSTFNTSTKVGLYSQFNGFGNSWDDFSAVSPQAIAGGSTSALSTSMAAHFDIHDVNPITGLPWTVADVNALEVGAEVV